MKAEEKEIAKLKGIIKQLTFDFAVKVQELQSTLTEKEGKLDIEKKLHQITKDISKNKSERIIAMEKEIERLKDENFNLNLERKTMMEEVQRLKDLKA